MALFIASSPLTDGAVAPRSSLECSVAAVVDGSTGDVCSSMPSPLWLSVTMDGGLSGVVAGPLLSLSTSSYRNSHKLNKYTVNNYTLTKWKQCCIDKH